ncbi:MAG: helix-turn-helix transcriptional regulator [Candidatus Levybacteria bacterium]|nr:helix-turn-helix transcriptional regulator [Candidatus Levybacteria bacterium]
MNIEKRIMSQFSDGSGFGSRRRVSQLPIDPKNWDNDAYARSILESARRRAARRGPNWTRFQDVNPSENTKTSGQAPVEPVGNVNANGLPKLPDKNVAPRRGKASDQVLVNGEAIKRLRGERPMRVIAIGSGTSTAWISFLETGRSNSTGSKTAEKIAKALGVSVDEILQK